MPKSKRSRGESSSSGAYLPDFPNSTARENYEDFRANRTIWTERGFDGNDITDPIHRVIQANDWWDFCGKREASCEELACEFYANLTA